MKLPARIAALAVSALVLSAGANPLDKTECIAPAKPGGGFDDACHAMLLIKQPGNGLGVTARAKI